MRKINNSLDKSLKSAQWAEFLACNINNVLLEKAPYLPDYFRTHGSGELVAVIPALDSDNPRAQTYYSVPHISDACTRLAPAFLFDNSTTIASPQLFDLDESKKPHYFKENLFLFHSEASCLYNYQKGYFANTLFSDMKQHIIDNPYAVLFKGCDDGHVGKRFGSREKAEDFLLNLQFFDAIFDDADPSMTKTLLNIKKENPDSNLSELLKERLEFHN